MAAPTFVATSVLIFLIGASALTAAGASAAGATSAPRVDATSSWTVYHGNPQGSGVDTSGVTFSPATPAWTSPVLDGQVFGEPLESGGRVYIATENDTVYALAANTGAILWSTHVGSAVPSGDLPCGDISPQVGITGTPVIDANRGEIFAVADELVGGTAAHFLVGFNMFTGGRELNQDVDPAGSSPPHLLQRTGLNLDNGNVVIGFGGNAGDCEPYHGWIVAVPEGGGSPLNYDTTGSTPNGTQGAVWLGARRLRSMPGATSGRQRGTGPRRPPTTAATRSSSCRAN